MNNHRKVEKMPLLKRLSSSEVSAAKYMDQRHWPGFGDAGSIVFGHGQTTRVTFPGGYNLVMRLLVTLHFVTGVAYCVWLVTELQSTFGYGTGQLFIVAEVLAFITRAVCFTQYSTKSRKAICPLHRLTPEFPEVQWPIVQFCVTHYREPVGETYQTVKNLLELDYPIDKLEINVLDDGFFDCKSGVHSPSAGGREMTDMLRVLISRMSRGSGEAHAEYNYEVSSEQRPEAAPQGTLVIEFKHQALPTVRHVCRRRGTESHFKGGNLNNAVFNVLNSDQYQFFAFLDCDMAPSPDFLQLSMPQFFRFAGGRWEPNWEVAMTQAPQCFHNLNETNGDDDPLFQKTDVYWRRTMLHLDDWGLVHYYGTNVVMFKPALEDSVGWQYGVLSEDTPTGANLTSLGWRAHYVDQEIATGLVKDNVVDTLSQRKRWAVGNVLWGLLKCRRWLGWMLNESFQRPPFYEAFLAREAAAKQGDPMPITDTSVPTPAASQSEADPEMMHPEAEDAQLASAAMVARRHDTGREARARRASSPWFRWAWSLSYWHVTWSNPVNALWFLAYLAVAVFMLMHFINEWRGAEVTINVLYPALHFVTTTTILFVIGPQSTLWRGCQDRFAFAWVRVIAIFDAIKTAVRSPRATPWNSSAHLELMFPPVFIFVLFSALWTVSALDCAFHYDSCAGEMQSFTVVSAAVPIQLVGLFLGVVVVLSMWPIFRCSVSNLLGYPMYKFRVLPGGAFAPYLLATAPVLIFAMMWVFLQTLPSSEGSSAAYAMQQICVSTAGGYSVAPSVFFVGCQRCATTSMFQDVAQYFPMADWGEALPAEDSSVSKDKHFFDDDTIYAKGWSWYLEHYTNCTTLDEYGYVGFDFTETYLESGTGMARSIYNDYSNFPSWRGELAQEKVKFVILLRDPIDRLFSYFTNAKADGSLDVEGVTSVDDDCLADVADCDTLTFDTWAHDQIQRAADCDSADPDANLWPECGTEGLFGGLYSQQIDSLLTYFNATQLSIVPMDSYTMDAPHILRNIADWLEMDLETDDFTEAAISEETDYTSGVTMAEATRTMLTKFYDSYIDDLLATVHSTNIHFVDVVEVEDLYRKRR